jgi:hypothetical protein
MIKKYTCLYSKEKLLKVFNTCSCISQSSEISNCVYSTRGKHRAQIYIETSKQAQLIKEHQAGEKFYKNTLKKRARSYDYESAGNLENGATVEKIQLSDNLYYKRKENYKLDLF